LLIDDCRALINLVQSALPAIAERAELR
jgi:hypothetical protein